MSVSTTVVLFAMLSVSVIGGGNWGTAIARIAAQNVKRFAETFKQTVRMYVYDEIHDNRRLSDIINEDHENPKYLPGFKIPDNVVAMTDLVDVARQSDIFIIVIPHQFLVRQCEVLKHAVKPNSFAVSLCKGFLTTDDGSVNLISHYIEQTLKIPCHVLMGASIANEVAAEKFCESTIGCAHHDHAALLQQLFETNYFRLSTTTSTQVAELCGALKNIVAVAVGFVDGLGYGDNTKAAIIRIGFVEMVNLAKLMFPDHDTSVFLESCGIADLVATCYGGRNRLVASAFVKQKKSIEQLEAEMLNGQKLQGPSTAKEVITLLKEREAVSRYPLFVAVYEICYEARPANTLFDSLLAGSAGSFQ
ncbi:hypothetical protein ACOME3_003360 [Neoechinorhynchus agilis]